MRQYQSKLILPLKVYKTKLYQVALSVAYRVQVNVELAFILLLGVLSEVMQGIADVQIPGGAKNPLSLWILLIANSGEGKTPVLNMLRKAIVDFENDRLIQYQNRLADYEIDYKIWKEVFNELSSMVRKAVRDGTDQAPHKIALANHMKETPQKPRRVQLTYTNATIEAFLKGLCENWPYAALVNDEASSYMKGSIANAFALLNQRWELGSLTIDRSSQSTLHAHNPSVTLLWAVQEKPYEEFKNGKGDHARNLGTLARFILAKPNSMKGYRRIDNREDNPKHLQWFYDRCSELLNQTIDENGNPNEKKITITFDWNAEMKFQHMQQKIEEQLRPGEWLEHANDYAAKVPRHTARIAAILELFEHGNTIISAESFEVARDLMEYYTESYIEIVGTGPELPQEVQDADKLYTWLHNRQLNYHNRYIVRNDIQKNCPRPIRNDINRLGSALQVLQQRGQIVILQHDLLVIDMIPLLQYDPMALTAAITLHRAKRRGGKPTLP